MTQAVVLVASLLFGTGLFGGCGSPLSVAVENHDATAYLLRVLDGRDRAWRVPASAAGTGPLAEGNQMRFVIISTLDCTEIARIGLGTGEHTLIIEGGGVANPDSRESIDPTLEPFEEIADPCL